MSGLGDATIPYARRSRSLPRVDSAVWHGPLGMAAQKLARTTEADAVAILVTIAALFGGLVGDGPRVRVGGMDHPARIWPLVVGPTGGGRKGTSLHEGKNFIRKIEPEGVRYIGEQIISGLASGEGLISALAGDGDVRPMPELCVVEPEFARVLAAARREGSTLSPVLRMLWDDGSAATMTRNRPLRVDRCNLVLIGHISPMELRAKLAESEISGGTVNRLLPIMTGRSQLLSQEVIPHDTSDLADILSTRVELHRRGGEGKRIGHTAESSALWDKAYRAMCKDEPDGLLGAVLARGPAYAMRIALLYALADGAHDIDTPHLRAGLALWQYANDTARLLFGDLSGRPTLDRLADFIARASGGRTRTEISRDCFNGNTSAAAIDELLTTLTKDGHITSEEQKTLGRPITRYFWTGPTRDGLAALLNGEP